MHFLLPCGTWSIQDRIANRSVVYFSRTIANCEQKRDRQIFTYLQTLPYINAWQKQVDDLLDLVYKLAYKARVSRDFDTNIPNFDVFRVPNSGKRMPQSKNSKNYLRLCGRTEIEKNAR